MIIEKGLDGWYVGQIEEIPGVLTQGKTVVQTKKNLKEALELFIETQREERGKEFKGKSVIREELALS
jgi:predicted RNase H-like HicB family nuclease